MTQVSMSQDEWKMSLVGQDIKGYIRGIRHAANQLRDIAAQFDASCDALEKQFKLKQQGEPT